MNKILPWIACFCLFLLTSLRLYSQSISYAIPTNINVCETHNFGITIANNTGATLNNPTALVQLPQGFVYELGTVVGGTQDNTSDLNAPVFAFANLANGATVTLTITVQVPCAVVDAVNNGAMFRVATTVCRNGGSCVTENSDLIDVKTPLLIITATTGTFLEGSRGQVLTREITVRNTRLGAVKDFTLTDQHQGCMTITSNRGINVSPDYYTFQTLLGAADFQTIGDGDNLFELNETIVIRESIEITCCGIDTTSSISMINVNWGCFGENCQLPPPSVNAFTRIKPSTRKPDLIVRPDAQPILCFDGIQPSPQGMWIRNEGDETAVNPLLKLTSVDLKGMDVASFRSTRLGNTMAAPVLNFTPSATSDCNVIATLAEFAVVDLPDIAPGDSIYVSWNLIDCNTSNCRPQGHSFTYRLSFEKECPPPVNLTTELFGAVNFQGPNQSLLTANTNSVDSGTVVLFDYQLALEEPSSLTEPPTLTLNFPCGWQPNPTNTYVLGGVAPTQINVVPIALATSIVLTYPNSLMTNQQMTFEATFLCDTLCLERDTFINIISTCPGPWGCDAPPMPSTVVQSIFNFNTIANCTSGPALCSNVGFGKNCNDLIIDFRPPGYFVGSIEAKRINFGKADNNDDRIWDGVGVPVDLSLIRRDRLMAGDTLRSELKGVIVVDRPGFTFSALSLFMNMQATGMDGLGFQDRVNGLRPINRSFRIYDKSANQYYALNNVPLGGDKTNFTIDANVPSLTAYGLPSGFTYENGDSIIWGMELQVIHNPPFTSTNGAGVRVRSNGVLKPNIISTQYDTIQCNCNTANLNFAGYKFSVLPGVFTKKPCANATYVGGSFVEFKFTTLDNFFSSEYRDLTKFAKWQVNPTVPYRFVNAKLTNYRVQSGPTLVNNQNITFVNENGFLTHNMAQYAPNGVDEVFSALFQYEIEAPCTIEGIQNLFTRSTFDLNHGFPGLSNPHIVDTQSASLRALNPTVAITTNLADITTFSNVAIWNLKAKNLQTTINGETSGLAPNVWVQPISATGLATNFMLTNTITGQMYPLSNGLFQLGNINPNDSLQLALKAINNSCVQEEITLRFGWNCAPFTVSTQIPCHESRTTLRVLSPKGELEMITQIPNGPFGLCDTIRYVEVNLFNADLGTVYNANIEALLPTGTVIVSGTSSLSYPVGNAFANIADPVNTQNGTLLWDLAQATTALQNGLVGVNDSPLNGLILRFAIQTTCDDFAAGSSIQFFGNGETNCGTPTNTVFRFSNPLDIDGVAPSYAATINGTLNGNACTNSRTLNLSFSANGVTLVGDSIQLLLPAGVTYVPGSFMGLTNAPTGMPSITVQGLRQRLRWALRTGLASGAAVTFTIQTTGWASLPCENVNIQLSSTSGATAVCTLDGSTCTIRVETGFANIPVPLLRPSLDFISLTASGTVSGSTLIADVTATLQNTGQAILNTPVQVQLYNDLNSNGQVDVGEPLLGMQTMSSTLAINATIQLSFNVPLQAEDLCHLLAVVDASSACICESDVATLTMPIQIEYAGDVEACSGVATPIGISNIPGWSYQWIPQGSVACDVCPMTNFNIVNTGIDVQNQNLTLTANNLNGCIIRHSFTAAVYPQAQIVIFDSPICAGDDANIFATVGLSYNWSGPGVVQNVQTQTLSPNATANYSVTITDANGCIGQDEVTIVVNPLPIANFGGDTLIFCDGQLPILEATQATNISYAWSPATFLTNVNGPITQVVNNDALTVSLTATNNLTGCSAVKTAFVGVGDPLNIQVPAMVDICLGGSVTVNATGAQTYVWTPAVACNNTSCSSVTLSPTMTTTYLVTGSDVNGCSAAASMIVTVSTDTIFTNGAPINLCQGQSIQLFGETVTEEGNYCGDFTALGGCDSVYCIQVFLTPPSDSLFFVDTICAGATLEFYDLELTDPGQYCTTVQGPSCDTVVCMNLSWFNSTPLTVNPDTIEVLSGNSVTVTANGGFVTYNWTGTGLTPPNIEQALTFTPTESGTVTLTVTDGFGCSQNAVLPLVVASNCNVDSVDIPLAFTPNNDQLNALFEPARRPTNTVQIEMEVWNRWGKKVFEGKDLNAAWDGKHNNAPVPIDVYGVRIILSCPDEDTRREYIGEVTLIR